MDYVLYVADTETTGLDNRLHDIIELSLYRLIDNQQKTWFIKPQTPETIDDGALRVNGHKKEDLLHQTKEGKLKYLDAKEVAIDVENWVMDDNVPAERRVIVGHNAGYDVNFMEQFWKKCGSGDSFPFGRRYMDTMQIELFLNYCQNKMDEGYSLANLTKKYGVKNEKAHSAEADTKATKEVFIKQVEFFKKILC